MNISENVVNEFCNSITSSVEWSGCGQFWAKSNPEDIRKHLLEMRGGELLYIKKRENDKFKTYYAEKCNETTTISDKSPFS